MSASIFEVEFRIRLSVAADNKYEAIELAKEQVLEDSRIEIIEDNNYEVVDWRT